MEKKDCQGCYNNDYNHGLGGAKECWSFDKEKELVEKYAIPVDLPPPYTKALIEKVPPCYTVQRYVYVNPEVINEKGYWR